MTCCSWTRLRPRARQVGQRRRAVRRPVREGRPLRVQHALGRRAARRAGLHRLRVTANSFSGELRSDLPLAGRRGESAGAEPATAIAGTAHAGRSCAARSATAAPSSWFRPSAATSWSPAAPRTGATVRRTRRSRRTKTGTRSRRCGLRAGALASDWCWAGLMGWGAGSGPRLGHPGLDVPATALRRRRRRKARQWPYGNPLPALARQQVSSQHVRGPSVFLNALPPQPPAPALSAGGMRFAAQAVFWCLRSTTIRLGRYAGDGFGLVHPQEAIQ